MLKQKLQQHQKHNAGNAEHTGDQSGEKIDGDTDAHKVTEEIDDKQNKKAQGGVDRQLENQPDGGGQHLDQEDKEDHRRGKH